jgi:hypothetical protein
MLQHAVTNSTTPEILKMFPQFVAEYTKLEGKGKRKKEKGKKTQVQLTNKTIFKTQILKWI